MELTYDIYCIERTYYNLFLSHEGPIPEAWLQLSAVKNGTPWYEQPLASGPWTLLSALTASILQQIFKGYSLLLHPIFFFLALPVPSET